MKVEVKKKSAAVAMAVKVGDMAIIDLIASSSQYKFPRTKLAVDIPKPFETDDAFEMCLHYG